MYDLRSGSSLRVFFAYSFSWDFIATYVCRVLNPIWPVDEWKKFLCISIYQVFHLWVDLTVPFKESTLVHSAQCSEVDSLDGTVGRRPQVKLRSRACHWSACTLRPIGCEHRALDLRLTWGFLPQSPFKKPVSVKVTPFLWQIWKNIEFWLDGSFNYS